MTASLITLLTQALVPGPWSSPRASPDERASLLLANMTLLEQLAMLHGPPTGPCCQCTTNATCAYVGNVAPNARLGIPPINMNDGPQGFRDNNHPATTTAWPSGLTIGASFDQEAALEWGEGMGIEFYGKGSNVQLGPGLCLARVPRNGRNFEYLSGEDPYLGEQMVQPVIRGIQSKKVIANAKHWIENNQETNRGSVSENVDERTRYEMYYPPFRGAADAGVGSVMCSYNKINGVWSCENPTTLAHDLKDGLGFNGFVMSDWGATHSASLMQGLDIEMPAAKFMNEAALQAKLKDGSLSTAALQQSVRRILRAMFAIGVMDEPLAAWDWKKLEANVTTDASVASARKLASASTVLLKNGGKLPLLPLSPSKSVAVIGLAADSAITHGGGSGQVVPSYISKPLDGIKAAAPGAKISFDAGADLKAAAKVAAAADVAIVFAGTLSHEGGDRDSLSLDDGCTDKVQCGDYANQQNALIEAVAAANPKTVVVLSVPGAILMPWSTKVAAILVNFMPGQQVAPTPHPPNPKPTHPLMYTHAHSRTLTHTHVHARTRTHTHVHTRAHTYTHAHTRTHERAHTHTRAHTHARICAPPIHTLPHRPIAPHTHVTQTTSTHTSIPSPSHLA